MLKISWYRLLFATSLLAPAVICQSVWPLVPSDSWEELSDDVYATLLHFQKVKKDEPSRVVVLEVDQKTIDAYGWPIDRSYYVKALDKLTASGRPWVLSLLQFQALAKAKADAEAKALRAAGDDALNDAIKSYGRYVGTGLEIQAGAELDADQEDNLMPRITLSSSGKAPDELPRLPLNLAEDARFVASERAFGFGTHFGLEPVVRCMQMYLTDRQQTGDFLIPSALVWTAAFATGSQIQTATGAAWPRTGEEPPFALQGRMQVSFKECLSSPGTLTKAYLQERGVQRLALVDFLENQHSMALDGKIVLLARGDMRRFRGPGTAVASDDGVVEEQLLAARFLDGLVSGSSIHRDSLNRGALAGWLPLGVAGGLLLGSLFLSTAGAIFLALFVLAGLLAFAGYNLQAGVYVIPVQTMASVTGSIVLLADLYAYLRYYGVRRQIRFSTKLREALSQCNTLNDVETLSRQLCQAEFENCALAFADFDRELYDAATDAAAATRLLDKRRSISGSLSSQAAGVFADRAETQLTRVDRPAGLARLPFRARGMNVQLAIESKLGRLGTVRLGLAYKPHEEGFIANLLDVLRVEVSQHWYRNKLLVDQKLLDYRYLREQTRGEIMARFLTKVLVAKFSDNRTMEENLRLVLNPRSTRAALMQADIRGYSKISAQLAPAEMVRLLQGYFRNVVDAAQMVAQVKLIGDCIFLFIEEEAARPGVSPADLALELAAILVAETRAQNALRARDNDAPLNFGIAIHYGEVVVGNLSSDSCIDYTVIGPNVNLVARMEEMTKHAAVAAKIGANGVLLSPEAASGLLRYKGMSFLELDLAALGVSVRSFAEVAHVVGLTADQALTVHPDAVHQPGLKQAG